nr:MBL fold metallo-hydrolase [Cellulosimicrobium arenosum]
MDGGSWDVDNNVWIVGDDEECLVIDPAHDVDAIVQQVGERRVVAIVLTHGHDDHVSEALEAASRLTTSTYLNPADLALWHRAHPDHSPTHELWDGDTIAVAGLTVEAIHTPGHTPGSTCLFIREGLDTPVLFSGDTLFQGGPGATGRSFSNERVIKDSIRRRLLTLPAGTVVYTGHGPTTSVRDESASL